MPSEPFTAFQWSTDAAGNKVILIEVDGGRASSARMNAEETLRLQRDLNRLLPVPPLDALRAAAESLNAAWHAKHPQHPNYERPALVQDLDELIEQVAASPHF